MAASCRTPGSIPFRHVGRLPPVRRSVVRRAGNLAQPLAPRALLDDIAPQADGRTALSWRESMARGIRLPVFMALAFAALGPAVPPAMAQCSGGTRGGNGLIPVLSVEGTVAGRDCTITVSNISD